MGILCLTGGIIIRTIVSIIIITRSIVLRSVFTKSSSIKLYKENKRLLFNSDPWPPAEQKLEMPCDNIYFILLLFSQDLTGHLASISSSVAYLHLSHAEVFC